MAASRTFGFKDLTANQPGSLNYMDGSTLNDLDRAIVVQDTSCSFYIFLASSGEAENSPLVISPATNPGNGRWHKVVDPQLFSHENLTTSAHGGLVAATDPRLTDNRTPNVHGSSRHSEVYIVEGDVRLTNSRNPNSHAASHAATGSDPVPPHLHKASHATGGSDELVPSDIGAAPAFHEHEGAGVHPLGWDFETISTVQEQLNGNIHVTWTNLAGTETIASSVIEESTDVHGNEVIVDTLQHEGATYRTVVTTFANGDIQVVKEEVLP